MVISSARFVDSVIVFWRNYPAMLHTIKSVSLGGIIDNLPHFIQHMSLELFVFAGTFLEEVIAPIPSAIVLIPAGAAAQVQNLPVFYLFVLSLFAACGRVLGGLVLYWLADKFEDVIFAHGRTYFGTSHKQVERFGQQIGKKNKRDWFLLFGMTAVPFFPGALLSLACGFVKVRMSTFITTTFFGTLVSGTIYLYIGFAGLQVAALLHKLELVGYGLLVVVAIYALVWWIKRKQKLGKHRKR